MWPLACSTGALARRAWGRNGALLVQATVLHKMHSVNTNATHTAAVRPCNSALLGAATLRPLIAAVTFDPETRILEVNFTPWPNETKVGIVPRSRSGPSGCNAPWRARA